MKENAITVSSVVNAPIEKVWECWTEPEHIKNWCFASDDWYVPHAENDVKVGGRFNTGMAAKDKDQGFDFTGTYTEVAKPNALAYKMDDGREVRVTFEAADGGTKIDETFDPESENSPEMQRSGWQSILDNFKKYTETQK